MQIMVSLREFKKLCKKEFLLLSERALNSKNLIEKVSGLEGEKEETSWVLKKFNKQGGEEDLQKSFDNNDALNKKRELSSTEWSSTKRGIDTSERI